MLNIRSKNDHIDKYVWGYNLYLPFITDKAIWFKLIPDINIHISWYKVIKDFYDKDGNSKERIKNFGFDFSFHFLIIRTSFSIEKVIKD